MVVDASAARSWASSPLFVVPANAGSSASRSSSGLPMQPIPIGPSVQTSAELSPRSDGLFATMLHRKVIAMICIVLRRVLAGYGMRQRIRGKLLRNPTIGRQGKSAACGLAQVVGWIEGFRHLDTLARLALAVET